MRAFRFSQEILQMEIRSKLINDIQNFILLLRSERKTIAPRNVFIHWPNSFEIGKQQDSYKYLEYLLNRLHEEENLHNLMSNNGNPKAKDKMVAEQILI